MNKFQKDALAYFNKHLPKKFDGRTKAIKDIMKQLRPMTAAKRWVKFYTNKDLTTSACHSSIDLSDVQELITTLFNRHGHIDVHVKPLIQSLSVDVVQGIVSEKDFKNRTTFISFQAKQGTTLAA